MTLPTPAVPLAVPVDDSRDHILGPADAPITLVEYADFECPHCGAVHPIVKALLEQLGNQLRFVFRHFPLSTMHRHAMKAAEAAECAGAQGKFWEMHDLLYAGFPNISRQRIMTYAGQLNLDIKRFTAELDAHKYRARVRAEEKEGDDAGVSGTPTFFINGKKYNRTFDAASVTPLIRKELKQ